MPPRCKNPNKPDPDDKGWLHYVEPYFGGGSVLLAMDPEGISEVANDLNGELTNFWRVLQQDRLFQIFHREIQATPFSKAEFDGAGPDSWKEFGPSEPVACAINFFIRCRQSLAGRMAGFAGITRNRTRRGMNEQVSAWLNCIEGLPAVHERLKRVLILNDDALSVIRKEDGERTLYYLDPPYLHETRATTGEYQHEMTARQHRDLLVTLGGEMAASACTRANEVVPDWYATADPIKGRFLLSGYDSPLYSAVATACGWSRHDFELPNNAAGGGSKRRMVESVWCNF